MAEGYKVLFYCVRQLLLLPGTKNATLFNAHE